MYDHDEYSELWNEMDEMLIQYPELSEVWLDRDKLASLRIRYNSKDELRDYFRKRAFTSLVMDKVFRVFEKTIEMDEEEAGPEEEGITLDNPELFRIWSEDVRDEYSDYPEFVDYVDKDVFVR